jgi:uncharacterized SAM-binding protein YcdF (DUF218 family)
MSGRQRGGIFFRLLVLLLLALLAAAVYVVRHPLLRIAGGFWVAGDSPERADAILVLGDDNFDADRAARAAQLFRGGLAPLVVASGRLLRSYAGIAELMGRDLQARGVPAAAILPFPHRAANTLEESQALRGLVISRGWRRVLVVTSNYHTRRARYIFQRVFPTEVTVLMISAADSDYDPDRWWETRQGRKLFFLGSVGYLTAVWESWEENGAAREAADPSVVDPPTPQAEPGGLGTPAQ